ncbi:MAG: hypothetical protein GF419_06420 [Ignavibacteriales bacterium]|nr:hypothetical protein [Ignavibacteriales bacterium]
MRSRVAFVLFVGFALAAPTFAQEVPASYSNIRYDDEGELYFQHPDEETRRYARAVETPYSIDNLQRSWSATETGVAFEFGEPQSGKLYYGLVDLDEGMYPQPVFFKRWAAIEEGAAEIDVLNTFAWVYDMTGWREKGALTLGYRVTDESGFFLYDGRVDLGYDSTATPPFRKLPTVIDGPTVSNLRHDGATVSAALDVVATVELEAGGETYVSPNAERHEFELTGLKPGTTYDYTLRAGRERFGSFTTAPEPGSREPFVFAYCSDSRAAQGGGERHIYGANAYIMKKIGALAAEKGARFVQFTGDLINGYSNSTEATKLQYLNWKRAVEPFAARIPFIPTMGNHEALVHNFPADEGYGWTIDRFPYETESAEAIFAEMFANPTNGPESEDGERYDPRPDAIDFPSYKENAFYYTYDNVAVVALNSDYWYAPSVGRKPETSGNLHGYLMDAQLAWLAETIAALEADDAIDHVFVTQHTPAFPNGGHVDDDMWYNGNNAPRAVVAGTPVEKGIIERRDEYLDVLVNQGEKTVAILTGDEHNFNYLKIDASVEIYPEDWGKERLELSRPIYQINNGAAGAPYYAQDERPPWSAHTKGFTTRNALVFFRVEGESVTMTTYNPDTLEKFAELILR